jgi:hypothetical protein
LLEIIVDQDNSLEKVVKAITEAVITASDGRPPKECFSDIKKAVAEAFDMLELQDGNHKATQTVVAQTSASAHLKARTATSSTSTSTSTNLQ